MKGRPRRKKGETIKQYANRIRLWENLNKGKLTSVEEEEQMKEVHEYLMTRKVKPKKLCQNCLYWKPEVPSSGGMSYGHKINEGQCTFNPSWVLTGHLHFCSHFNGDKK